MTDWFTFLLRNVENTLPPKDWESGLGIKVLDPDGWRYQKQTKFGVTMFSKDYRDPVSLTEFLIRCAPSTLDWSGAVNPTPKQEPEPEKLQSWDMLVQTKNKTLVDQLILQLVISLSVTPNFSDKTMDEIYRMHVSWAKEERY